MAWRASPLAWRASCVRAVPGAGAGASGWSCGERVGASPCCCCYLMSAGCCSLDQTWRREHLGSTLSIPCAPFGGARSAARSAGCVSQGLRSETSRTHGPACPGAATTAIPAQEFGCAIRDAAAPPLRAGGAWGWVGGEGTDHELEPPAALGASPPGQPGVPCLPGKLQMVNHRHTQANRLPGSRT